MAAGWVDILQSTIEGDVRDWLVTARRYYEDTADGPAEPAAAEMLRSLEVVYSDGGEAGYGPPLLPCYVRLGLLDEDGTIYELLTAADDAWYSVSIESTDGQYALPLLFRLDTLERTLFPDLRVPILDVYAYDGMALLEDLDPVGVFYEGSEKNPPLAHLFAACTMSIIDADLQLVLGWSPSNASITGARITHLRPSETYYDRVRDSSSISRKAQFEQWTELFDAQAWLGLDGLWHVQQRRTIGEAVTSSARVASLLSTPTGAPAVIDLAASVVTITDDDLDGETKLLGLRRLRSVGVAGVEEDVSGTELVTNGEFEDWTSTSALNSWTENLAAQATRSRAGYYALQLGESGYVEQSLGAVVAGADLNLFLSLYYRLESYSQDEILLGTASLKVELRIVGASTYYFDGATGTWTTSATQNATEEGITMAGGTAYDRYTLAVSGAAPVSGTLYLKIHHNNPSTVYTTALVDSVSVKDMGAGNRPPANAPRLSLETPELTGVDVNAEIEAFDGSNWEDPATWVAADAEYAGQFFGDIRQLMAQNRLDQQSADVRVLMGRVLGILPPETTLAYEGSTYRMVGGKIDLLREVTEGIWVEKIKTFS